MKIVVFGLSVSSSWGNGHATLWRGLIEALSDLGHNVVFFERNVPYYASHRDRADLHPAELVIYSNWEEAQRAADPHLVDADVAMVTSYCPDGPAACDLVLGSKAGLKVFYDLDAPVTIERIRNGLAVSYLPSYGLGHFDLVLSFTGGAVLDELQERLGAKRVAPLYGCVDPKVHHPTDSSPDFAADLSYLGTYSPDRQDAFERLLLRAARSAPRWRFVVGGSQYPEGMVWPQNVRHIQHVFPDQHSMFYSSSPLTLNLTRAPMAARGFCPSGRMFEAAACGSAIVTDSWKGLESFYEPDREILTIHTTQDALVSLSRSKECLAKVGRAARERTLAQHTAKHRAAELIDIVCRSAEQRPAPIEVMPMREQHMYDSRMGGMSAESP